jgi:hypothetical protein
MRKTLIVPRAFGFAAPRTRCNLRFSKDYTMSNATQFNANILFWPTYAYDIDPLVASTAMPGFAEWAQFYSRYVVRSSRIRVDFMNNEAFPAMVFVTPTNLIYTMNTTLANVRLLLAQPYSRSSKIGALTGNGVVSVDHTMNTDHFTGFPDVRFDDTYGALTTGTAPLNNWYWNIGWISGLAGTVSGMLLHIELEVEIEFYELYALAQ